jgi:pyruvate/2-oxoglutarate dehydrogenase complex dihydrolipoamide dehydrogenase (E3) component
MTAVLRTHTTGETTGSMKEAVGDRILGFTMIGPEAGEVIAAVQIAMLSGLPYMLFRDAILAHPTMAEGLNALFATIPAAEALSRQRYNPQSRTKATRTEATSNS